MIYEFTKEQEEEFNKKLRELEETGKYKVIKVNDYIGGGFKITV
jgi:hypothetical protein